MLFALACLWLGSPASALAGLNDDSRELHAVGVYEGTTAHSANYHPRGQVVVDVLRPGKQVTLFLSSYEPVLWTIRLGEGTQLERLFVSGYSKQDLAGVPDGTPVFNSSYDAGFSGYLVSGWTLDSGRLLANLPKIVGMAGLELSSFHVAYTSPYPEPFVIDSVQADPRFSPSYPEPTPAAELPQLSFSLDFWAPNGERTGSLLRRAYTLAGPVGASEVLPPEMNVVGPPGGPWAFGVRSHSVYRIDAVQGIQTELDPGPALPELSWPMGVAYDSLRDRVLLASLGGEGFLYAYSVPEAKWTQAVSLQNRDVDSLVYHAPDDALYALLTSYSDYGLPTILKLSPDGAPLGQIALERLPFSIDPGGFQSELVSVGDFLVLLLGPRDWYPSEGYRQSRIYLIDPATGRFWLTYRTPASGPAFPSVTITSPAAGEALGKPAEVELKAEVTPVGEVWPKVEFRAGTNVLGWADLTGVTPAGKGVFRWVWSQPPVGTHALTARAVVDPGRSAVSAAVTLTIEDQVPTGLTWVSPQAGAVVAEYERILFEVEETPAGGWRPEKVEFRLEETTRGGAWVILLPPSLPGQPVRLRFLLNGLPAGQYEVFARAESGSTVVESPRLAYTVSALLPAMDDSPAALAGLPGWAEAEPAGLRLARAQLDASAAMAFTFAAAPGAGYAIEWNDSLQGSPWRVLTSYVEPHGSACTVTLVDAQPGTASRFYRLRQLEPVPPGL